MLQTADHLQPVMFLMFLISDHRGQFYDINNHGHRGFNSLCIGVCHMRHYV